MAIVQGDIVALKRDGASLLNGFYGKKPTFGVISSAAAPWDVLWEGGVKVSGVPSSELDKITFGTGSAAVVRVKNSSGDTVSPHYDAAVVIALYSRDAEGAGSTVTSWLLAKALNSAQYFEVGPSDVEVLEDR